MSVSPARLIAYKALLAIDRQGAYMHLALHNALSEHSCSAVDAGLASELVHGVTVWRRLLDHWLTQLAPTHDAGMQVEVRQFLRMGLYQLRFLERVPSYAVVHDAVELAKRHAPRAAGFVNGVLRASQRETDWLKPVRDELELADLATSEEAALRLSYPDWIANQMIDLLGHDAGLLAMLTMNQRPVKTLRVNRLACTREQLMSELGTMGIACEASPITPDGVRLLSRAQPEELPAYQRGWCTLQGESSMLVAAVLQPQAGEVVLDACAAPGGKATHMAELSGDAAVITAAEQHGHRARTITAAAVRLGLHSIQTVVTDARLLGGQYDAVLLDAPCSGLGTIARKSDLKWTSSLEKIKTIAVLQAELLDAAAQRVRPGGRLLYSTCTLSPLENEQQRQAFLQRHPEFSPLPFTLADFQGTAERMDDSGAHLIRPQDFGGDGFYLAYFRNTAVDQSRSG